MLVTLNLKFPIIIQNIVLHNSICKIVTMYISYDVSFVNAHSLACVIFFIFLSPIFHHSFFLSLFLYS